MRSHRALGVLALAAALASGVVTTGAHAPRRAPRAGSIVSGRTVESMDVDDVQIGSVSSATLVSSRSGSGTAGYVYLSSSITGQTPAGFGIWVSPSAKHHWIMGKYASATAAALRQLGTKATYRGYGSPAAKEGVVRVREGDKGCGNNSSTVGVTWTYWNDLPSGKEYVTHADVYLCPRLFRLGTWATQATVGHEIGHAMGLGHVAYRYLGSYQLMNPTVRPSVLGYRSGDKKGLIRLARQTAAIKADIPPLGKLEHSDFTDGSIKFSGWALMQYFKSEPVEVTLTDNGNVVDAGVTSVVRPDINASLDPGSRPHGYDFSVAWSGGRHQYCIQAAPVGHPAAKGQLGCITWSS